MSGADEVLVVGAGLAGLAAAHYLAEAGLAVSVIERAAGPGTQTSFANGGLLTPSMSDPWNAPGVHWQLLRWLGRADAPLLLRPTAVPRYLGWGLRFLANSAPARHRAALEANLALSMFSLERMRELRAQFALDYAHGTRGTMKIFRDARAFSLARDQVDALRAQGLESSALDAAAAVAVEPALAAVAPRLAGALLFERDETGDAHRFCRALAGRLAARGARFCFDTAVRSIHVRGGRVQGVETAGAFLPARRVVVAAAAWSTALLAPLGVRLHIRPVKGYSLSLSLREPALMPRLALVDDSLHVSATPLGGILRLAGTAEFCGWNPALDPARLQNLWHFLADLSPALYETAQREQATPWCGFRPMSADGRPYIGPTAIDGLWVNSGHGHLGWTQAMGSGMLLAQLMLGAAPAIDPLHYSPARA